MAEDFAISVARWCEAAGDQGDAAFRAIAEAALETVKQRTPVRTGNLRANWQVVLDGEAAQVLPLVIGLGGSAAGAVLSATGKVVAGPTVSVLASGASELAGGSGLGEAAGTVAGDFAGRAVGGAAGAFIGGPVGAAAGSIAGGFIGGAIGGKAGALLDGEPQGTPTVPADAAMGQRIVILNPVVYARAVEYGREIHRKDGGITRTTGRGMVQQTIAEMPAIADQAVRKLLQGGA